MGWLTSWKFGMTMEKCMYVRMNEYIFLVVWWWICIMYIFIVLQQQVEYYSRMHTYFVLVLYIAVCFACVIWNESKIVREREWEKPSRRVKRGAQAWNGWIWFGSLTRSQKQAKKLHYKMLYKPCCFLHYNMYIWSMYYKTVTSWCSRLVSVGVFFSTLLSLLESLLD